MNLLNAEKIDIAEILALQKICYLQEAAIYGDYEIPPLVQSMASIEKDFDQQVFLKIVEKGTIIGSVRGYEENGICKIGRLIVHPDFQNRGLGKQLMNNIESYFSNVRFYELFTGHQSLKNLAFYQKLRYKAFKRKQINNGLELVFLRKVQIIK